ncbi:hypothetical protein pb186bvf_009871 [Paramecium bursaria]
MKGQILLSKENMTQYNVYLINTGQLQFNESKKIILLEEDLNLSLIDFCFLSKAKEKYIGNLQLFYDQEVIHMQRQYHFIKKNYEINNYHIIIPSQALANIFQIQVIVILINQKCILLFQYLITKYVNISIKIVDFPNSKSKSEFIISNLDLIKIKDKRNLIISLNLTYLTYLVANSNSIYPVFEKLIKCCKFPFKANKCKLISQILVNIYKLSTSIPKVSEMNSFLIQGKLNKKRGKFDHEI